MKQFSHFNSMCNTSKQKVHIIAVSKKQSTESIEKAKILGFNHFGESYTQEMISKKDAFKDCILHFIGRIQTNKAEDVVKHCHFIHSIDRLKLATAIEKACAKNHKHIKGFVQVNLTNEKSKGGVSLNDLETLLIYISEKCTHINLIGLMYIPPKEGVIEELFKQMHVLNEKYNFNDLSMGMSADYETAIKNGATYIRIGTAIFGQR